ncbi:hypothetical protein MAM1_0084d04677 [Mucor ambiguus]|uniref:Uncharacterized protein n=1 Tax=Mucor ambiguus TaxID=91626 RepID=A0A0C9MT19_9FUNG|nr:hypothetical protein MAM1_0084d04677 [Mucor ambiguus]
MLLLADKYNLERFSFEGGSRLVLSKENDNAGMLGTYMPIFMNQQATPLASNGCFTGKVLACNKQSKDEASLMSHAGLNFGCYTKIDENLGPFMEHSFSTNKQLVRIDNTIDSLSCFTDENEGDAVNSNTNDNGTANAVEATTVIISGLAKQEVTDDVALPPTAKYSKIWIHLRPDF